MKKIFWFLLTLGLTGHSFAQHSLAEKSIQVDELMRAYAKVNQFNGSVLVAKGDSVIYKNAFGLKRATTGELNAVSTLFRIYSITKTFTSTVIFKLIEEDKLSLDDKLSKFYPSFPDGNSITVQHLITHTSGIYDYTRGNDMKDESERSFIRFLSSKPLDFRPGNGWSYSNSGYWLLGFIIEKVTGLKYEQAVKQYIFDKCGMTSSGFDFKTMKDVRKATGYDVFSDQEKRESVDIDPPSPYAAGAIYSTVEDLYRYYLAHESFRLISRTSLETAWMPGALNTHYGSGWQVNELYGKRMIYHGGGGPGFKSNFSFTPQDSICVILLINNGNTNLDVLTHVIYSIVYGKPYKKPFEIAVSKNILSTYEGFYEISPSFSLHILMQGKRLMAQATGQPATVLLAEKSNYFYSPDADAYLEFIVNDKDSCREMILHSSQGDRQKHAIRYEPSWGILGSATEAGWEGVQKDIALSLVQGTKNIWELKGVKLKQGELKFRFNNDWDMNYGMGDKNGALKVHGKNITVKEGIYDLKLDLSDERAPRYKIVQLK